MSSMIDIIKTLSEKMESDIDTKRKELDVLKSIIYNLEHPYINFYEELSAYAQMIEELSPSELLFIADNSKDPPPDWLLEEV